MLNRIETRIGANTFHMDFDPEATLDQEGAALVAVVRNGKTYATPSKGVKDEMFIGFSTGYGSSNEGEQPFYPNTVIPSGTDANGDPVKTQLWINGLAIARVKIKIAGTAADVVTSAADLVAGKVLVDGNFLVFHADDAGKAVTGYVALKRYGDPAYNGTVVNDGRIAIIRGGDVSTDMFDLDASYVGEDDKAPPLLYTGPNGTITTATAGTKLGDFAILAAPEVNDGWLKVRAAG